MTIDIRRDRKVDVSSYTKHTYVWEQPELHLLRSVGNVSWEKVTENNHISRQGIVYLMRCGLGAKRERKVLLHYLTA